MNVWVDTVISTYIGEGSAAAIGFSARLLDFVYGLAVIPVTGIAFSYMSECAAKKDYQKMLEILWRTVRLMLFAIVPVVAVAVPSARDIVQIVYQRGQFTSEATLLTGSALIWYLPGLIGTAAHVFLLRVFYVLQDTKTPMLCGVASVSVNISLSIALSRTMGISGIALATSIGSALSALLLLIALRRKLGPLGFGKTAADVCKMLLCAVPCVLAVLGTRNLLSGQNELARFAACAFVGGAAYLIPAFFLKEMALADLTRLLLEHIRALRKR
jgi:putative peptidoglycan lipid II flippase